MSGRLFIFDMDVPVPRGTVWGSNIEQPPSASLIVEFREQLLRCEIEDLSRDFLQV